jgi:hypothetical protein
MRVFKVFKKVANMVDIVEKDGNRDELAEDRDSWG